MINLTINGMALEAPEGWTVLQAAEAAGIVIPTLCHHPDLTPFGGCRLCVVEVKGARLPATACNLPVSKDLQVQTETPRLVEYRRAVLKMLLSSFYDAGYKRCGGEPGLDQDSQFAYWVRFYGLEMAKEMAPRPRGPVDSDPNPYVWVDMNKCIQCTRCVRACAEIQGRFVWAQAYRGSESRIVAGADSTMLASRCESCGACVAYCPTGALDNKMSVSLGRADRLASSVCSYCSVGCSFDLNVKEDVPGGRMLRVTSNPGAPVNGLHLCLKGRYGYEFIHDRKRLQRPMVRRYLLEGAPRPTTPGAWVEVGWDTALELAAEGLWSQRLAHGAGALGVIGSGKLLTEESYLVQKLARQVLGTDNIDVAAHLQHDNILDGMDELAGWPAMTHTFDALIEQAGAALTLGSQTTEQHPVFGVKLRQAALRGKLRLVAADQEFSNMMEYAAQSLVYRPGTEVALLNGLMHLIVGWEAQSPRFNPSGLPGYLAFHAVLEHYPPRRAAEITGVPAEALERAARLLVEHRPAALIWSVGVTRAGPARPVVASLVNLQLLLGGLGEGLGLAPLVGQNNLQGALDMGCRPGMLPGGQPLENLYDRELFEQAWGAPLPAQPGLNAAQMLAALQRQELQALYLIGEDLPLTPRLRSLLRRAGFVVVQQILPGEIECCADVLLPGAAFAEKTGVCTNAERRVQLVQQAIEPPGQARPDWVITASLARRIQSLSERSAAPAPYAGWDYRDTAQILAEIAALAPAYAGVSQERLARGETLHWPVDDLQHPGTPVLPVRKLHFTPVGYTIPEPVGV